MSWRLVQGAPCPRPETRLGLAPAATPRDAMERDDEPETRRLSDSDSPDEVEQGVGRGHDGPAAQPVTVHLRPDAGLDDDDEQNADHHSDEGGPQVVRDGQDAHPTARLRLHRRQTGHQTADRHRLLSVKPSSACSDDMFSLAWHKVCM